MAGSADIKNADHVRTCLQKMEICIIFIYRLSWIICPNISTRMPYANFYLYGGRHGEDYVEGLCDFAWI